MCSSTAAQFVLLTDWALLWTPFKGPEMLRGMAVWEASGRMANPPAWVCHHKLKSNQAASVALARKLAWAALQEWVLWGFGRRGSSSLCFFPVCFSRICPSSWGTCCYSRWCFRRGWYPNQDLECGMEFSFSWERKSNFHLPVLAPFQKP